MNGYSNAEMWLGHRLNLSQGIQCDRNPLPGGILRYYHHHTTLTVSASSPWWRANETTLTVLYSVPFVGCGDRFWIGNEINQKHPEARAYISHLQQQPRSRVGSRDYNVVPGCWGNGDGSAGEQVRVMISILGWDERMGRENDEKVSPAGKRKAFLGLMDSEYGTRIKNRRIHSWEKFCMKRILRVISTGTETALSSSIQTIRNTWINPLSTVSPQSPSQLVVNHCCRR